MSATPPGAGTPDDEVRALEHAVADLESRRAVLGDGVVEVALAPLRRRLGELRGGGEQRRIVTVLFADLVDFTALSARMDPEDVRSVVDRYFARWSAQVAAHGGVIEKFIGDAVMAVFGLERSFEDDAHRAVRAALAVQADLPALRAEIGPLPGELAARIGIDTGEVVVSTLGDREGAAFVAVGPAVNRAARLQAAAPVGGVLLSEETRRLVRGAFRLEAVPGLALKGIDAPVDAWRAVAEVASGFRSEQVAAVEGVRAPTVGREWQLRELQDRLDEVAEDRVPRVVTVVGEAGIGKTRLLLDFDRWLVDRPEAVWWFRGRAAPANRGSAGALLRDVLAGRLDVRLDDDRDVVRDRLRNTFEAALDDGGASARDVARWLGFEDAEDGLGPQALRDRGSEALARYFGALADRAPVVLLLEDLHWADDETLRWLDALPGLLPDRPLLVVASTRPDLLHRRPHRGEGLEQHLRVDLPPLTRRQSRDLVLRLLVHVPSPPRPLVELLLDAGEGNPFYLEELVGWLVDVGVVVRDEPHWRVDADRVGAVAVPATLRGVLQARLDALGTRERALLQRAAVIGRVFWDTAVDSLDRGGRMAGPVLDGLRDRDVVLQREASRFSESREFVFKHALLRDVAYDAVLRRQRERYHRAAAAWLVATSGARADEYAAVVADHLERAGDPEAARWYLRAAERAAGVYALTETAALLQRAEAAAVDDVVRFDVALAQEALLDRTGDREGQAAAIARLDALDVAVDDERRILRLLVHARWRFVLSDNAGTLDAAGEAAALAEAIDREDLLAEALAMQGKARTWNDEVELAEDLLRRAEAAAQRSGRRPIVAEVLRYRSMLAGNVGDFAASIELGDAARALFAAIGDAEMEAMALAQSATTHYRMGRYDAAQAALEESLRIFRRAGHRYREVMVLGNLASVATQRGEFATALRHGTESVAAQRELGDRDAIAVSLIVLATAALLTGDTATAEAHLEEALEHARAAGSTTLEADGLVRLSNAALVRGDADAALAIARRARAVGRDAVSALDRMSTELALGSAALAAGRPAEAEEPLAAAAATAAALDLPALRAEAAAGLAAVRLAQGDPDAAVALVAPLLDGLTADGLAGAFLPGHALARVVAVLEAAGDPRAATARRRAVAVLEVVAERAADPDLARGWLGLPVHAALLAGAPRDDA